MSPEHDPSTELASLLSRAANFSRIVVLGLQRSGTHVAAEILAHERSLPLYSERDFNYTSCQPGTDRIQVPIEQFVNDHPSFVLQAPALLHAANAFSRDDLLVVFVARAADEVRASRVRSQWPGEASERLKYERAEYNELYRPGCDLVDMQLAVWEKVTKPMLKHVHSVPFHAFSAHEFWLSERDRAVLPIGKTRPDGNWQEYKTNV